MTFYNKINLMLPTRKRVQNGKLKKYLESAVNSMDSSDAVVFTFLIDSDDQESADFLNGFCEMYGRENTHIIINNDIEKPHLGNFYNKMYEETKFNAEEGTLVSMTGDDMVFNTQGWDSKILSAANQTDGLGIIYCDDDYVQHENLCVNLFVSRRLVKATGKKFMCPLYAADYIDTVWMNVGHNTGLLTYLGDVKITHEHSGSKTPDTYDETFLRLRGGWKDAQDHTAELGNYVHTVVQALKSAGVSRKR